MGFSGMPVCSGVTAISVTWREVTTHSQAVGLIILNSRKICESLIDVRSLFLHIPYIFREYRSSSRMNVIGSIVHSRVVTPIKLEAKFLFCHAFAVHIFACPELAQKVLELVHNIYDLLRWKVRPTSSPHADWRDPDVLQECLFS